LVGEENEEKRNFQKGKKKRAGVGKTQRARWGKRGWAGGGGEGKGARVKEDKLGDVLEGSIWRYRKGAPDPNVWKGLFSQLSAKKKNELPGR